jgi:ankyrin repeat protein
VARGAPASKRSARPLRSQDGYCPLYLAAQNNHLALIELLDSFDADLGCTNRVRRAPHGALVLTAAAQNGSTPVFIAAQEGHAGAVTLLQMLGADVDLPRPVRACAQLAHHPLTPAAPAAQDGLTAVFAAAQRGRADVIDVLHDLGAQIDRVGPVRRRGAAWRAACRIHGARAGEEW